MSAAAYSWCTTHFGPEGSPTTASLLCQPRIHGCGQLIGVILNYTEHTCVGCKEAVRTIEVRETEVRSRRRKCQGYQRRDRESKETTDDLDRSANASGQREPARKELRVSHRRLINRHSGHL